MSDNKNAQTYVDDAVMAIRNALIRPETRIPYTNPYPVKPSDARIITAEEQERARRKAEHLLNALKYLELWSLE